MNVSFAVRITVDTPVALRELLHLDGLLGTLAIRRGNAPSDIPLQRTGTVWHGSAALLETGVFGPVYDSITRIKHIAMHTIPENLFSHLPPARRRIGSMSPFRNAISTYSLFAGVYAIWFLGRGCIPKITDLLGDVYGVGSMSQTGYGHVTGVEVVEIPDAPLTGIVLRSGLPARVVPLSCWTSELGQTISDDMIIAEQAAIPPYWTGEQVTCVAPMQIDLLGTRADIHLLARGE